MDLYDQNKVLWPIGESEFWGFFMIFIILWLTNMAGVGGAGIQFPICLIFFNFDAKNAIALSNFSTALAAMMRTLINSQ